MNRSSALNILFSNEGAGMVSDDEPEDHVEEDSDCNDEIEVNYADLDVAEAISLELDLIRAYSTQPHLIAEEAGPAQKKSAADQRKILGQLIQLLQFIVSIQKIVIYVKFDLSKLKTY